MKAKIHQLLQNPIYYGEFYWLGQLHQGLHKPIITRDLFDRVQQVFAAANHPRQTKRRHAFAGLVTCRLQQQQMLLRSKLDRVYEDRLSDAIPEELWNSKSAALQDELRQVRTEMERHEVASQAYETAGLQILELAQTAYSSYVAKNPHEQARLIKTLVSNSTFDRGSLSPTYVKPFDVFAKGSETGDWLLGLDSNQQPSG